MKIVNVSRILTLVLGLSFVSMFASSQTIAAEAKVIDARVDAALTEMFVSIQGSEDLYKIASGVLIMPDVTKAGFIIGGAYGEGALRVNGKTEAYYSVGGASVGFLAGAETSKQALFFMADDALGKFRSSENWQAGIDASITLIKVGAGIGADTLSSPPPVIGFIFARSGLMADASFKGAKYGRIDR